MYRHVLYSSIFISPIVPFLFCGIFHSSLQIIIAFFGAFIWIIAFLVSSTIWKIGSLLYDNIYFYAGLTIIIQEIFRILFYYIIRYGEKTLAKLESRSNVEVSGYSSMDRDINDVSAAAGFGMGVISQALLTVNNFVHDSKYGVPGIAKFVSLLHQSSGDTYIPKNLIISSLSVLVPCINLAYNLGWTMLTWKSLHKFDKQPFSFKNLFKCYGVYISIFTHFLVAAAATILTSFRSGGVFVNCIVLVVCPIFFYPNIVKMTEDEEKFYMIMNQNHLFRRVLDLTSTRDCHSLSRVCKYLRRRTRFFKYRRNFDCRDHEITLDVQNLPGSNFWQASSGRGTIMSFCNFRRKCNFKITGDSYLFSIEDHKRIGGMMDEILDCLGNSKEVKIEVALTACFGEQLCDVISELRKDRITRISFCLDEVTNITGFGRIPRNIFYGLRNVREIILEIYNELQVSFVDYITDCAVYMEGVEVLIYFDTSIGRRLYNSFRYMLEKGIFLSLHEKSYHSQDYTLQYLTSIKYKSLHFFVGLSVHINSGELLEDYLSIFSKMENLKYLTLYFKDGYNNYSRKVLWGNPISFVVKFHSMRNLRKLKTLSLYNFSSKISGSLLVSLLKCFPTQVRSLKLHGFDRIDQEVCLEINKALPLLTTLMFSEIKNVGVQCLKKLKKLRFFITTQSDIVYIPRKIKACMVIDKECYENNEVNKKCCEAYRKTLIETGVFTKEYFFGGLENCSIFFNRFGSVKNIIEAAFNLKDYSCTQY